MRRRSAGGSTCSILASALSVVCSAPRRPAVACERRPTAIATPSSSVSRSGGRPGARLEPVAAGAAAHRLDAVAELAQPLDVAAQRALADAEAVDEFARRPVPVALQQGEEFEGPRGGGGHVSKYLRNEDRK